MACKEPLETRFKGGLHGNRKDLLAPSAARKEDGAEEGGAKKGDNKYGGSEERRAERGRFTRWPIRHAAPRPPRQGQAFLPRRMSWAAMPPATRTARKMKTVRQE